MENKDVQRRSGSTRRTFLSASAATAVAAPIVAQSVTASAAPVAGAAAARSATISPPSNFDPALRALLRQIDPPVLECHPESNLAKYEVVKRETTAADWTDVIDFGNVTTVTLDIAKDNVQFGLRAVDTAGNRSPVAFPIVVG
jgi:hypothetical protein